MLTLALQSCKALPGVHSNGSTMWVRDKHNPVIANGVVFDAHQAADPKVYWDNTLEYNGTHGAWVMLYFGCCANGRGASIDIAFSLDAVAWTKVSAPLYLAGGNPHGLDSEHAHKALLICVDNIHAFCVVVIFVHNCCIYCLLACMCV